MNAPSLPEFTTGECRWCGNAGTIYADNQLCEECDNDVVRCSVCNSEEHRDDHCRHVFQNSDLVWMGAGVGIPHDYDLKYLKRSLFRLFDRMPSGFVPDLRRAIRSGGFYTWSIMPLIGGGGLLELNGMPSRDGKMMIFAWGDIFIKIGEASDAEQTSDGYRWLASLFKRKTHRANQATIGWIDEWLSGTTEAPMPRRRARAA